MYRLYFFMKCSFSFLFSFFSLHILYPDTITPHVFHLFRTFASYFTISGGTPLRLLCFLSKWYHSIACIMSVIFLSSDVNGWRNATEISAFLCAFNTWMGHFYWCLPVQMLNVLVSRLSPLGIVYFDLWLFGLMCNYVGYNNVIRCNSFWGNDV